MAAPFLSPTGYTLEALVSSSFTGADEDPLSEGGVWTGATGENTFLRVSNAAAPFSVLADCGSFYSGFTWPNDQWSRAKLTVTGTAGGGQGIGLNLRTAPAAQTYYRFVIDHAASNNANIGRKNAGGFTSLVSWTQPFTDGDEFTFGVQGNLLFVLDKNGAVVQSFLDSGSSTIDTGSPGLSFSSSETTASLDDWSGGKFSLLARAGLRKRSQIIARPGQEVGATANSVTSVSKAFPLDVVAGSLILIYATKQTTATDVFVAGDCTKSAGTATLGTIALDRQLEQVDTTGTPVFQSSAVYSAIVTGAGTLTMQVAGALAASFMNIGIGEYLGNWDGSRLIGGNGSSSDTDNAATAQTGNVIAPGAALFAGALAVQSGTAPYVATPESGYSVVYEEQSAASSLPCSHIRMILPTGATRQASWVITATNGAWAAVVVAYKEAAVGAAYRRHRGRSRDGMMWGTLKDIKRWF